MNHKLSLCVILWFLSHSAAAGATYQGTISRDGKTISGGWRPDKSIEVNDGNAYDMTMYRVR